MNIEDNKLDFVDQGIPAINPMPSIQRITALNTESSKFEDMDESGKCFLDRIREELREDAKKKPVFWFALHWPDAYTMNGEYFVRYTQCKEYTDWCDIRKNYEGCRFVRLYPKHNDIDPYDAIKKGVTTEHFEEHSVEDWEYESKRYNEYIESLTIK